MDTQAIQTTQEMTQKLLSRLNIKAGSVVELGDSGIVQVSITPQGQEEGLGILIGHHGETLNAIQTILSMIVNRGREEWMRILVDVDNYRLKQQDNLRSLAQRMAEKAIFLKEPVALSPMTSFDRRVVHMAISEIEGVESESIGEGSERKVVIKPLDAK